jgi:subtilisin family serine protease
VTLGRSARLFVAFLLAIGTTTDWPAPAWARATEQSEEVVGRRILVMLRLPPAHYRPDSAYSGGYGDRASLAARRRIALDIARRNHLELVDSWPMPLVGVDCFVMQIRPGDTQEAVVARVARNRNVVWAEPLRLYRSFGGAPSAGDPLLPIQPAASRWQLAALHRMVTGRGVTVAVVDSRIEVGHPDLAGQFAESRDFVTGRPGSAEQHGTAVAGVIAAKADNGMGIAGIAPDARLMALRACWQTNGGPTVCDTLSLAKALHYAIDHHAQVINLSLSGPPDRLLQRLIGIALTRQTAVVASFDPSRLDGGFPASLPGVVAVATADQGLASLPSRVYGAPGNDVPTTRPGGTWDLVSGSSYAAAHISGLMALIRQTGKTTGRAALVASRGSGGVVDACATLVRTSPTCDCLCAVTRKAAEGRLR